MKQTEVLRKVRLEFLGTFRTELETRTGRRLFQEPTELDQLKLLSLRTWALANRLPVGEVIELLVEYWASQIEKRTGRKSRSLGVRISTLCGDKSEEVLEKEIKKRYPNDEHVADWRNKEQRRLEDAIEQDRIETRNYRQYARSYMRQVKRNRKKFEKKEEEGRYLRRRYPGNPWTA